MHYKDVVRLFNGMYDDEAARFSVLPGITPNWPPKKLVALYEFVNDPKKPQDAIAKELGVDRSTISRKVGGMDWKAFGHRLEQLCTMSISDFVKSEATEYKKDKLAREAKKSLKNEIGRAALMEALSEKIRNTWFCSSPICTWAWNFPSRIPGTSTNTISKPSSRG